MASFKDRVVQNIPGKLYVDGQCIYCGLCDEIAPTVFRAHEVEDELSVYNAWAYVYHQPETPDDLKQVMEAVAGCPTESIGIDGEQHD